jgi:hypothetical protein
MKDPLRQKVDAAGITRANLEQIIDTWIFSDRDRYILKRFLADHATYSEIADEMAGEKNYITESAIGKRCRRAFAKIATKLQ